jgi:protein-tyrosine phosphatase
MDDGAADAATSASMLRMFREQGVERIIATPHFDGQREAPETFLNRREQAFSLLKTVSDEFPVLPGAEVLLYRGISEKPFFPSLKMGKSRLILLEPPHGSYRDWIADEIFAVALNWGLVPVIAHVERYLGWYKRGEIEKLLGVEGTVIQLNNSVLRSRSSRNFAFDLIESGFPVVFGSDAHGIRTRPPDFDGTLDVLKKGLTSDAYQLLIRQNEKLLEE